jgi:hypothetical protein
VFPKIKLTKVNINSLKASVQDMVYWDDTLAGFGLKVTPKGCKVFFMLYRTRDGAARLRKYTIGPYGTVTPAIARATAQRVLAARQVGRDPAGVKRQARIKKTLDVIDAVVDSYLVPFASRNRSAGETKRVLNREVLRAWSGRSSGMLSPGTGECAWVHAASPQLKSCPPFLPLRAPDRHGRRPRE